MYHQKMKDYATYWKDVEELDIPFPSKPSRLQLGFWPSTSYITSNSSMFDLVQIDTILANDCGVAHDNPKNPTILLEMSLR